MQRWAPFSFENGTGANRSMSWPPRLFASARSGPGFWPHATVDADHADLGSHRQPITQSHGDQEATTLQHWAPFSFENGTGANRLMSWPPRLFASARSGPAFWPHATVDADHADLGSHRQLITQSQGDQEATTLQRWAPFSFGNGTGANRSMSWPLRLCAIGSRVLAPRDSRRGSRGPWVTPKTDHAEPRRRDRVPDVRLLINCRSPSRSSPLRSSPARRCAPGWTPPHRRAAPP